MLHIISSRQTDRSALRAQQRFGLHSYTQVKDSRLAREYVEERNGGYYVAGTRVSLDSIVQCFTEGLSPEAILGEFETLYLAQVYGAITHYLENQPSIDAYRVRQKQRFAELRRSAEPLPAGLGQRLQCAREQLARPGHSD